MSTSIEWREDGAFRVTRTPLSESEVVQAVKKHAQQAYSKVRGVAELNGNPVTMAFKEDGAMVCSRINSLTLKTHAILNNDHLVPVFNPHRSGAVPATLTWAVPDGMRLFLVVQAKESRPEKRWLLQNAFLISKAAGGTPAGYFRLLLPNIYPDGRACLGTGWPSKQPTLVGLLEAAQKQLQESPWNTDLMPEELETKTWSLFRFSPATLNSVAPVNAWHTYCQRVNRTEYDQILGG